MLKAHPSDSRTDAQYQALVRPFVEEARRAGADATALGLQACAAGFTGTLWLPPRAKAEPPGGFTGYEGRWPTPADLEEWRREYGFNLALTLRGSPFDSYLRDSGVTVQRVGLNLFLLYPSIAAALARHGRMTSSGLLPPLIP